MLSMRTAFIILLAMLALSADGQTNMPLSLPEFDKVVIYDFEDQDENLSLVDGNGALSKAMKIKKQVQLDQITIKKLNSTIRDKRSYRQVKADCFEPHLGLIWYFKGKIAMVLSVCMDCNVLRSNIYIPARHKGRTANSSRPYNLNEGMNKPLRKFLNSLLVKYSFSHQIKPGSAFDR